ncbi:putative trehalose-phosphate phosphatase D [Glycine max]|nr:putative trehalose-phosphate phosphatase D [Glycine max]
MGPTYSDMGCKLALEDKKRVAFRRRHRHEHVDATRHAKPCNCSSLASQQQKGHRTKEKLIQFLCSSCLLCVCCPLACVCCFIKLPCRICHQALRCAQKWACYGSKNNRTVVLKVGMSCQGCAGAVNRILGKMEGIFIPASYLYYQIQNENDLVIVAIFNSNILTPTINYGCHLHSSDTGITDIALHSSGIKSEKDISGLCAMSRCFPFPPPGYTNKGYEKEGYNRGRGITDKALAEKVRLVLNEYPQLKLTQGRKVLEICLTIKWDNGKALEFLLESLGYENSNDVFPIYIGDDRTDEDAFRVTNVATPS